MNTMSIDERIVRGFLNGEENRAEEVVDYAPVYGKRYSDACERIDEIKEVREALDRLLKCVMP
jgi:hypothetical protein